MNKKTSYQSKLNYAVKLLIRRQWDKNGFMLDRCDAELIVRQNIEIAGIDTVVADLEALNSLSETEFADE